MNKELVITVSGYVGSGKSTIATILYNILKKNTNTEFFDDTSISQNSKWLHDKLDALLDDPEFHCTIKTCNLGRPGLKYDINRSI